MALVFPFEPALYNQVDPTKPDIAHFVGHPLLDVVHPTRTREETLAAYGLDPARPVLALLPGSRRSELDYLLHPLVGAAKILGEDGWQAILPLATGFSRQNIVEALGGPPSFVIAAGDTYNILAAADAAVGKSGTATLETALLGCPAVIVYRMAWASYLVARALVHVEQMGIPNIILQRNLFPELIQNEVTSETVAARIRDLPKRRGEIQQASSELRTLLGGSGAADRAAELALGLLG